MVNTRAVAAAVGGGLLALFGAGGTLIVLAGAVLGYVDLTLATAVFPLAFVAGAAVLAYGVAALVNDLANGLDGHDLTSRFRELRRLVN